MPPAAQQLAELADDVLMQLATLLAIQASSESCAALSALCSTCSAFRRLANEAHAWEHAASALGLAPAMPPSAVLAVCRADDIFRAHSAEPCEGLHVAMLPRDGGWARRLLDELQPSGLCVTAELDDSNVHVTRTAPFVLVHCDAAPGGDPFAGPDPDLPWLTVPFPHAACAEPAALGCWHCRKHGGRAARWVVPRCAAMLRGDVAAPSDGLEEHRLRPRRVLFAARSSEVRDAYRKAARSCAVAPAADGGGARAPALLYGSSARPRPCTQ